MCKFWGPGQEKPTHILVIDVTTNVFKKETEFIEKDGVKEKVLVDVRDIYDQSSERTFFELQPINYLQFNKPGVHNLIFILINFSSKKRYRESYQEYLKKSLYSYDKPVSFESIESGYEIYKQCGYCEVVVDIPKEFFAEKPKSGIKLALWKYVNSWYRLPPIDQCEFRKRSIFAFTGKPILLLIAFIFRLVISIVMTLVATIPRIVTFIFGYQPVRFMPQKKELWWEFLFLYTTGVEEVFKSDFLWGDGLKRKNYDSADEQDFYAYKDVMIGKKLLHVPFAIYDFVFYFAAFKYYYICLAKLFPSESLKFLPSLGFLGILLGITVVTTLVITIITLPSMKQGKGWKDKWDMEKPKGKKLTDMIGSWLLIISFGLPLVLFIIYKVPWKVIFATTTNTVKGNSHLVLFILTFLACFAFIKFVGIPLFKRIVRNIKIPRWLKYQAQVRTRKEGLSKLQRKDQKEKEWLKTSFDIATLPQKVDVSNMPKPSTTIHVFRIKFWQTKAKVCKPYAK